MPPASEAQARSSGSKKPLAFVGDEETERAVRQCFDDLQIANAEVVHGGVRAAVQELAHRASPQLLIVDISQTEDPIAQLNALAEVCDPDAGVIVIGDRNDIALYRNLRHSGVVEYFYKPLVGNLFKAACHSVLTGKEEEPARHTGKLIFVVGVRGGAGATTIAVNTAWHLSESLQRKVALVDLDLRFGDAALQLNCIPTHALREALESPERIDDVFLERGIIRVTDRLGLLASLEDLNRQPSVSEQAILTLVGKLLPRYRYVIVDLPVTIATGLNHLLSLPSVSILVSTSSLVSARDVARWRKYIGPDSQDRSTIHIVNKNHLDGSLPDAEFAKAAGTPPDIKVSFLRDVVEASNLGLQSVTSCRSLQHGLDPLYRQVSGETSEASHGFSLKRLFG